MPQGANPALSVLQGANLALSDRTMGLPVKIYLFDMALKRQTEMHFPQSVHLSAIHLTFLT